MTGWCSTPPPNSTWARSTRARSRSPRRRGALFFQLNSLPQGQTVTFNTPRGAVQITAPGTYEIVAGDTSDATMVSVVEGAAHVTAANLDLQVGPQQTATIGGTDTLEGSVGALQQDSFPRRAAACAGATAFRRRGAAPGGNT